MSENSLLVEALGGHKILGDSASSDDQISRVIEKGLPYGAVESFLKHFDLALQVWAGSGRSLRVLWPGGERPAGFKATNRTVYIGWHAYW